MSANETRDAPWWMGAVIYQIYPRSFADANGDGVGDLEGIRRHLDHLQRLGVDALWLSPVYRSPMADAGYDVSDHCDVDPVFGTLAGLDALIGEAHARGLRVLLDFVPNHTSDRHPWFIESRASRDNPKRDWYFWRDEPNNWLASLNAGRAWTFDAATGQYYLHFFLPQQPDLNWRNPGVTEAMHGVMRFWLDRGVDGFRLDAVHCLGKDPSFADDPRCDEGLSPVDFNDQPGTHEVLRGFRRVVNAYPGERVLVGEVNVRSAATVLRYYGAGDELQMSFNFTPLDAPWEAAAWRRCIEDVQAWPQPGCVWPTWVLSNHDHSRHRSRFGGSMACARAAAVLLMTLRGTPFVYQGEELGVADAVFAPGERVDPGGRDGSRAPLPWEPDAPHGWAGARPWLPFPPQAGELAASRQWQAPDSILHLYRRLIAARKASPALRLGSWEGRAAPASVLAYERVHGDDRRAVAINFAEASQSVALPGAWQVEVASGGTPQGEAFRGELEPLEAVLLRPA